jgi:predicted metal-binding membrane protein
LHYAGITGRMRDLRVGVRHGAYCVGCCWGLMAVLVLLGAMNLWFMALFTGIVFAEKIWRYGGRFSYGVGIVLGLSGLATLMTASI